MTTRRSRSGRVPFVVLLALEEDGGGRMGACCHTPAVAGRGIADVRVGEDDHEDEEEEAVQDIAAAVAAKDP